MEPDKLILQSTPDVAGGTMLLAFSGWMDGGDVSTGTVGHLIELTGAKPFALIEPHGFYLENFPGNMNVTAIFRPHVCIEDGVVTDFEWSNNVFFAAPANKLVVFRGKEPNLDWREFGECVFAAAARLKLSRIIFIGSFAGSVPHTREPRLFITVSEPALRAKFDHYALRPANYEGPASFASYLISRAQARGFEMASLVAEIPAYIEGTNPMSIEAVTRRLAAILELAVDLDALRGASDEWEAQISTQAEEDPDLAEQIRKLEIEYDDDLLESTSDSE